MGERDSEDIERCSRKIREQPRKVSRNPDAAGAGPGAGLGAGTGSGTDKSGTTETYEKEGASILAVKDSQLKNVKTKTNKKPRKTTKKEEVLKTDDVKMLIIAIFGMIASRPGYEHWAITDAESEAIAKPLTNVLSHTAFGGEMEKHGDLVMLCIASVTILIPRIFISIQKGGLNIGSSNNEEVGGAALSGNENGENKKYIESPHGHDTNAGRGVSENMLSNYPVTA